MDNSKIQKPNHLVNETSPYLLQHVHNVVDWYPWSKEAFQKARDEDKMIFLSIGYSTCHWCHVMAHESFENTIVAEILAKDYVAIKVDREERPDIDDVYMNVCQTLTGSGGWPLTVFLTAEKKPFYAGTYFPTNTHSQRIGIIELLEQISNLWHNQRKKLLDQSDVLVNRFKEERTDTERTTTYDELIKKCYHDLEQRYDPNYGGFNTQPKFPTPHNLFFLNKYYISTNDKNALLMVEKTLKSMYEGGIFDHVEYGFSRYSTDNKWLAPHFEKMLYDNALLIIAYSEAYAITKNPMYREIIQKITDFLINNMISKEGAFYCAFDADSQGIEGKYYVFSYNELDDYLEKDELEFLEKYYNLSKTGNFEGKNILNKIDTSINIPIIEKSVIKKLFAYRQKRIPPFLDTKILSSWNGLIIAALSIAGRFIDGKYTNYAKNTVEFIFKNMMDNDYNLYTTFKDGKLSNTGFLADYANIIWGLIELYKSTLNLKYLKYSLNLSKITLEKFWDEEKNKFFMTQIITSELPFRPKDDYDGAMPSGNSVMIMNLVKLYNLTYDTKIKDILDKSIMSSSLNAEKMPSAYIHFISALLLYDKPQRQIVITGKNQRQLYDEITKRFMPFTTTILYEGDIMQRELMPELNNYKIKENLKAYICEDFICIKPITSEDELLKKL